MLTPIVVPSYKMQFSPEFFGEGEKQDAKGRLQRTDKVCILIIEDNPGDVFIMEEALREHNLDRNITVLSDGEQAASLLDRIDNDPNVVCPNIVLLDLNLPKRSGHWVLSRIRTSFRCSWIPVVIVSSSQAPADMDQNQQLGATAYFRKPSSLDEFLKLGALVNTLLFN